MSCEAAAAWMPVLICCYRPFVLYVLATAGAVRPEGESDAVAVWNVHLAVGLERDMTGGRVARDKTRGGIDEDSR